MLQIQTARLTLRAQTAEIAEAELENPAALPELLGAAVPADWPPPLNDRGSFEWAARFIAEHPDDPGWGMWYFIADATVVGVGGYTGVPNGGICELGYSVVPEHQRRGYATEAVRGMIDRAFADVRVCRVIAHTFPDLTPSIRVLEKCGFVPDGPGAEPGTVRYRLNRAT